MLDILRNPKILLPAVVLGSLGALAACGGAKEQSSQAERTEWTIDNIEPQTDDGTKLTIKTTTVQVETGEYQDIDVIVRCEPTQEIAYDRKPAFYMASLLGTEVCADGAVTNDDEEAIIARFKSYLNDLDVKDGA